MTTYARAGMSPPFSSSFGNRVVTIDKATVTANLAIGDKVRCGIIPAGTLVDRLVINNGDLDGGTTLTDKIGYEPIDGSTGDDDAFCASGATTRRSAATTTYEFFPPIKVTKDSFVTLTVVAAATSLGASADVYAKMEGEILGAK